MVSLVGQKIRSVLHEIGPAFEVFEELPVHLVSQAASDLNLSLVVEEGQSRRIIQALHGLLVQPVRQDAVFGPTWEELQEAAPQPGPLPHRGGRAGAVNSSGWRDSTRPPTSTIWTRCGRPSAGSRGYAASIASCMP